MEDLFSEAIKEAYSSQSVFIAETLEIYHSSWTNPVYVVNDKQDLSGLIEGSADRNPETVQLFLKCSFSCRVPDSTDKLPEFEITIDGVTTELINYVLDSIGTRSPIHLVYREYLLDDAETNGPHFVLKGMTLNSVTGDVSITGTATFGNLVNKSFPNKIFNKADFPGLIRG